MSVVYASKRLKSSPEKQHHKEGWVVLAIFRLHVCGSPFVEELCIKKEKNIQIWGDFSPLNNSL